MTEKPADGRTPPAPPKITEEEEKNKKMISTIDFAWILANKLMSKYSFVAFSAPDQKDIELYIRGDDGIYREAHLPSLVQDLALSIKSDDTEGEPGIDGEPPKPSVQLIDQTIADIKRAVAISREFVDEAPDRIKVKNGVLFFFETPEHLKDVINDIYAKLVERLEKEGKEDLKKKVVDRWNRISWGATERWMPKVKPRKWAPHLEEAPSYTSGDIIEIRNQMENGNPVDPIRIYLNGIPVEYDPQADCPNFKKFVSEVVRPEDVPVVQEMMGYCLWRGTQAQTAFFLVGEGNNGKSTLLEVIKALLGEENVSHYSLYQIATDRFVVANLYGKLANLYADLEANSIPTAGMYKMLVTGDTITAQIKFKQKGLSFSNYAKMIFTGNELPSVHDESDAFFRRNLIISFPYRFYKPEEINELIKQSGGEIQLGDIKIADPNLKEKLTTPQELSGILNWALEGLHRLIERGWQFSRVETIDDKAKQYKAASDPVTNFASEELDVTNDPNDFVERTELLRVYYTWCDERNIPHLSRNKFYDAILSLKGYTGNVKEMRIAGKMTRAFVGLRLRHNSGEGEGKEENDLLSGL